MNSSVHRHPAIAPLHRANAAAEKLVCAEILTLAFARSKALVEKDATLMRWILAENFSYTNASGEEFTRDAYIERYVTSPLVRWNRQSLYNLRIWQFARYAVLTCTVCDDAVFDGFPLKAVFQSLFLYGRHQNGWRCLAGITRECKG